MWIPKHRAPRWVEPLIFALAIAVFWAVFSWVQPARGQELHVLPSTPDISITVGATSHIAVPGAHEAAGGGNSANWISIKNDCADAVYFDLNPPAIQDFTDDYGLRLNAGETFTMGSINLRAVIGASPGAGNVTACTVTIMFGVL